MRGIVASMLLWFVVVGCGGVDMLAGTTTIGAAGTVSTEADLLATADKFGVMIGAAWIAFGRDVTGISKD